MRLIIVTALLPEAKPIIEAFSLKPKTGFFPFNIYEKDELALIVTGIGQDHIASAVSYISGLYNQEFLGFINLGICGHRDLDLGTLCVPSKIVSSRSKKDIFPSLLLDIDAKVKPLYTLSEPSKDYFEDALFDMEAYDFFSAAQRYSTLEYIVCLKIVSDNLKNPIENVTSNLTNLLITKNLENIKKCITTLLRMKPISMPSVQLRLILDTIYFTESQRIQLEKLTEKFQILRPGDELPLEDLRKNQTAKAVLKSLENILIESPLELL